MVNFSANNITATVIAICMMGTTPSSKPVTLDTSRQTSYVFNCTSVNGKTMIPNAVLNSKEENEKTIDIAMLINLEKIEDMAHFEFDWDGNDADPYSPEEIQLFRYVIKNLNKQPKIAPTAANSLLLQYSLDDSSVIYYNIAMNKTERVLLPSGDVAQAEEKIFTTEDNLIAAINYDVESIYGSR